MQYFQTFHCDKIVSFLFTDTNPNDTMTLHWWMHWFWVTAQVVGESIQSLLSDKIMLA